MRAVLALLLCSLAPSGQPAPVPVPVPRPEPLLGMNLGGGLSSYIISSHLETGWARYLETVPATRLVNGVGSWTACQTLRTPEDAERILGPLHDYGFNVFRDEIGWGQTLYRRNPAEPMQLAPDADAKYRAVLRAAKRHGFRLIILLNAHQGVPCGTLATEARFLADAREGATQVLLDVNDPSILRLGYSGLSGLTEYCAAEGLFRSLTPDPASGPTAFRATLGKPLPKDYPRDTKITIHTLQYRPFGDKASDPETYQGWADYADLLARIAAEEGMRDGDLDFELWNEMTFGTMFLSIRNYDPGLEGEADPNHMLAVAATAIRKRFPLKTTVINGFSNTSFFFGGFWVATRPPGVNGESYHPYGNQWRDFPAWARDEHRKHLLEAFRNVDGFVPQYGTLFPEHSANYLGSHSLITLLQPEMRAALVNEGRAPVDWKCGMTEDGLFLNEVKAPEPYASLLQERPEHYVSKYWLRLYPFYLNKGMSFVCDGSLRNPGDWKEGWEAKFAASGDVSYLQVLQPLQRMLQLFRGAVDVPAARLIRLQPRVFQLAGQDKVVFGTEGAVKVTSVPGSERDRPWDPDRVQVRPLTYRDVFCLLPFQIDDHTLALGAYIQTRNLLEDVPDAGRYRLTFPGLTADARQVTVYDPLTDRPVSAEIASVGGVLNVTLTLTDYPVWIVLRGVDGPRGGGPVTATTAG